MSRHFRTFLAVTLSSWLAFGPVATAVAQNAPIKLDSPAAKELAGELGQLRKDIVAYLDKKGDFTVAGLCEREKKIFDKLSKASVSATDLIKLQAEQGTLNKALT